ncbi:transposase [Laspinema olomoucense]|uniref:transposase n=1 Tax=Laspinema olomoucense TaxID=3231600 RepID=UPI0021BA4A63|nr:transposase [Laspinema sp. D3c]MCT7993726.1 transposase [Laspinema sp. D3c]
MKLLEEEKPALIKNESLLEWMRILSYHMPTLTIPQLRGLAAWSFGMVMTRNSSLTKVSTFIASINDEKPNTVKCRLKQWYTEKSNKNGRKRSEVDVTSCFGPLLKWVYSLFSPGTTYLPLALDATNIKDKFTVLTINVLYNSCAIPVAWKVIKGGEKGSWKPIWESLFRSLTGILPPSVQVLVSADRGLYANWLYDLIREVGWHPFLRINHQGSFSLPGISNWKQLSSVVPQVGTHWAGQVVCFKTNPIHTTLLARWDEGYKDPWLILTDFPVGVAHCEWYGTRSWIECSYRDVKSDGWLWQNTRLTDPNRADRHWLAIAVATLWMVSLGSKPDGSTPERSPESYGSHPVEPLFESPVKPKRSLSCFSKGLLTIIADLIKGVPIRLFPLIPDPLPLHPVSLPLNTC